MSYRLAWAGFAALGFLSGGCGTAQNLNPSGDYLAVGSGQEYSPTVTRVYGGVRDDWSSLVSLRWNDEYSFINLLVMPLYLADLPLSAVADTLTLPYTVGLEVTRSINPGTLSPESNNAEAKREQPTTP